MTANDRAAARQQRAEEKAARKAAAKAARGQKYAAMDAAREKAKAAKAAAHEESLAGSVFVSTPCYDSLWTYVAVFPDRVEERSRNDVVKKVCFLRNVSGLSHSGNVGVTLKTNGQSEDFYCGSGAEAKRMVAVVTGLIGGST